MTQAGSTRRVTVVRRTDCSHGVAAIAAISALAERLSVSIVIDEVLVRSEAEARAHRCLGSPTILIDGLDVEPTARGATSFALT